MPRRCRPLSATGLALTAVAVVLLLPHAAAAQTPLPDSGVDLLQPSLSGRPANPQRFRRTPGRVVPPDQAPPTRQFTTPSRIGATPTYGSPPAFGAGNTGYDSTNTGQRTRRAPPAPSSPGSAQPETTFAPIPNFGSATPTKKKVPPPATPPNIQPRRAASRPGAVLPPPAETAPVSNPPPVVYPRPASERPGAVLPIPAAVDFQPSAEPPAPGTPLPNTLPLGTAPHRPLPLAVGDPYEALGLRAGSFLLYPAVELSTGYDTNPQHVPGGASSPYWVFAPELQVKSDWSRHSLTANITGTYTDYTNNSFTPSLSRPYFNATVDGRIDVRHDTQILLENRYIISTDNPGSPNIQAGLAKLPIYMTVGGTLGLAQEFNRLQVTVKGTFDRTTYGNSLLTDGESVSNADRVYDQYGGILRVGYELNPGFKPFVEIDADERIYDLAFDSAGLQRNSRGTSFKAGSDINLFGSLTGEFAFGYLQRLYQDPTLPSIGGLIADGSLIWQATALTTAKLTATSTVSESILPGTSGEFSRDFTLQVDHAFMLWLIGSLQAGYGHDNYVGFGRQDNRFFTSGGLTYKLNRDLQLKGTIREDWLTSNVAGVDYHATSFLLGVRLQR